MLQVDTCKLVLYNVRLCTYALHEVHVWYRKYMYMNGTRWITSPRHIRSTGGVSTESVVVAMALC